MNILDTYRPMNIWVMPPSHNLSENKGAIPFYNKANMKLRFATSSEFSFQVPKKYYDERIEQWVDNELYDKLDKNTVLFTDWDNQVNSVATHYIPTDDNYYRQSYNGSLGKYENINFELRNEEKETVDDIEHGVSAIEDGGEIYYIKPTQQYTLLTENGYYAGKGALKNLSGAYYNNINGLYADSTYYEVSDGDIIHFQSYKNGTIKTSCFKAFFYSEQDENTILSSPRLVAANTTDGFFETTTSSGYTYEVKGLKEQGLEKAYVRFSTENYETHTTNSGYDIIPIRIYSGKRHLHNYNVVQNAKREILSAQYWVIKDVNIENNLLMPIKTIVALSYDYVLKSRNITMNSEVVNLYTPPQIKKIIENADYGFRVFNDTSCTSQALKSQSIAINGIVNQILDVLPNWQIGYISTSLTSKYRTFTETESLNLYTLLTETIPSLWNCFVILDTKNLTINIFDKEDTLLENDLVLSFNNAVKSSTISSEDTDIITALHIHTNDDAYFINLINPTGDDIIYDFSNYSNDLSNYVGSSGYSLYQRILNWQEAIQKATTNYRKLAKTLIENNQTVVKLKSQLSVAKSEYLSKIKIININNQSDDNGISVYLFNEKEVMPVEALAPLDYKYFGKADTKTQIIALSENYWLIKKKYDSAYSNYSDSLRGIKAYNKLYNINNVNRFSPDEHAYLSNFIIEGHWTDENAVFSEDYSTEDIYDTLTSTYDKAKSDMSTYIAKPSYDVNISLANIMLMSEYEDILKTMYLGSYGYVEVERGVWEQPVLLEIDIDFDNKENCAFMFSTNYKRKPLEMRFRDLFDQISKVSVTNNSYTYDDSASTTETLEVAETAETTIE